MREPLAIGMLLRFPRVRRDLTLGIRMLDVTVDLSFGLRQHALLEYLSGPLAQVIFLGFMLGTAPWRPRLSRSN